MTIEDCLRDELEYANWLHSFFVMTRYEIMISETKKRILAIEKKLEQIKNLPETIY